MNFNDQLRLVLEAPVKAKLHQGLWPGGFTLDLDAENTLKSVAQDFVKEHNIPSDAIADIIITGSMANYNWTRYSDIDLHLLIDFDKFDDCQEILDDYYGIAKSQWNDKHNITIYDHEVEIYVQDSNEPHHSTGVYSLKQSKWLTKPSVHKFVRPDKQAVLRKVNKMIREIRSINVNEKDAKINADRLMELLKDMRMEGLRTEGEYSVENLVYKHLRNKGYLERLKNVSLKSYDKQLSVEDD